MLVWLASIMLGWHYSVDGYVAVFGVAACWWVAGWLTAPIPAVPVPIAQRISAWRDAAPEGTAAEPRTYQAGHRGTWTMWP